ncbi:MAG: cytochrome c oxidase subunit II [Gemmatimonadaceae bacterium]|nr:cytochrome c oxidase subunit II [Gemmatimonadaceae bacterium]
MLLLLMLAACVQAPSFMRPASEPAHRIAVLGWWLIAIATIVFVVVMVLLLVPLMHRRQEIAHADVHGGGGERMILIGGALIPAIILIAVFLFSLPTLSATITPSSRPRYTIEVSGHQWWWEVTYHTADPSFRVTTANEIHIPVGEDIGVRVNSRDVAHSFWVPELQGKIDLIPGQTNTFWLRADKPGIYRGQCAEYCGMQHAHMGVVVVAQSAAQYADWLRGQEAPVTAPRTTDDSLGAQAFQRGACSLCHTIRGTDAHGVLGPDLTHVGSRLTLAAGMIPNTRGHLQGWIANAQGVKPGVAMPTLYLDATSLQALAAYLESLR